MVADLSSRAAEDALGEGGATLRTRSALARSAVAGAELDRGSGGILVHYLLAEARVGADRRVGSAFDLPIRGERFRLRARVVDHILARLAHGVTKLIGVQESPDTRMVRIEVRELD